MHGVEKYISVYEVFFGRQSVTDMRVRPTSKGVNDKDQTASALLLSKHSQKDRSRGIQIIPLLSYQAPLMAA